MSKIRVLVTGGPTRAYLDQVRFLTNVSSGILAYELCRQLCRRGVEVVLVCGPTTQPFKKLKLAEWIPVDTTEEMQRAVMSLCRSFRPHFAVFSAAVLDFVPDKRRAGKVSSQKKKWQITLRPTPKIIDEVRDRFPNIRRIGFKLEARRGSDRESARLIQHSFKVKKLDALCLNFLSEIKEGKHPAQLITKEGETYSAGSKREIARWITGYIKARAKGV